MKKWLLVLALISGSAFADYTVCWEPPTHNTDETPLTDLDGYSLWALPVDRTYGNPQNFPVEPAETCAENRGPADCYFRDDDGKLCYHKFWPSPEGDWKLKMQAFNTAGISSANSTEILFELKDLNGDGNPDVVGGADPGPVVVPPPVEPPIEPPPDPPIDPEPPIEPPPDPPIDPEPPIEPVPPGRSNSMTITRKGFYTIIGPDGALLLKPDGNDRSVTSRDEAYEWITQDGRCCLFTINQPPIEVEFR